MVWRCGGRCQPRRLPIYFNCLTQGKWRRYASNNAGKSSPERIRNLAVVAHIDSGKTTLTESILSQSGYLSSPGTVDTGSTTTDFLPAERERGITIQSASIPVRWKDWTINLVDTPGHADFGMEVESASRVVDGAIVLIDAVEGVESQTQGVWRQLDRYNVSSRIVFLNKLDRTGADFRSSVLSLLNYRLHRNPTVLTLPVASFDPNSYEIAEPGIAGIVDLVKWELWKWDQPDEQDDSTGNFRIIPLPMDSKELEREGLFPKGHQLVFELVPARTALLDNLAVTTGHEELMDILLNLPPGPNSYLSVKSDVIIKALREGTLSKEVLPVLCGSAMKHIGTDLVLDYAGLLLASPLDITRATPDNSSAVQMLAWKVAWDKRRGWMTFVRIYSGTLTRQASLWNVTRNLKEKVSKMLLFYASQPEEVDVLTFGSIGVILGLKHTRTGDTLVSGGHGGHASHYKANSGPLRDINPPPAVMAASIVPQSNADLQPVQDALFALSRTDPSARVEIAEGQLLVHGLGALHLEIIEGRLRDEWGVAFEAGKRRVTYRESFPQEDEVVVDESWKTDLHGISTSVQISLAVRALQECEDGDVKWDENLVLDAEGQPLRLSDSSRANILDPLAYIAQGISSALLSSPHSSLPFSRTRIQVRSFATEEGVPLSVLAGASSVILRKLILNAGMGPVMEPYIRLKIVVTEEQLGKIMKDLTENGGEVLDFDTQSTMGSEGEEAVPFPRDGAYIPPGWMSPSASRTSQAQHAGGGMKRTIRAIAPLSRMLDFNNRLRALSGGHGTFEMTNAGFRSVREERREEILREIGRA